MKMGKASEADLAMAMDLVLALEEIERGHFPGAFEEEESEQVEWLNTDDCDQYERLVHGLQKLLNKGSISRVVWGMAVVCDPSNECIDPDADVIEHHPKRQQMEAALLWVLYFDGGGLMVGQPIRKLLGIGECDQLTDEQIAQAKAFGEADWWEEL